MSGYGVASTLSPALARSAAGRRAAAILRVPVLAVTSGVLYSLAQPPADLPHVSWVCLVPLLVALRSCRSRRGAAVSAFAFAIVFSALVAGWLPGAIAAFFALPPALAWAAALAVYAVFAGLPLAPIGALVHRLLVSRGPAAIVLAIPALWVGGDLLRTHVAGGLPWGLLGHALYRSTPLIQIADLTGVAGVSWMIALVNVALFETVRQWRRGRRIVVLPAVALAVVGSAWLYGHARLAALVAPPGGRVVRVGVLQSNEPPAYHFTRVAGDRALLAYARLSQRHFAGPRPDVVVWPENAIPFYVEHDQGVRRRLRALADGLGASLVLGAPASGPGGDTTRYFNAAHVVIPGVGPAGTYRKQRLVPFAEYQPGLWAGDGGAAFSAGSEPGTFAAAGLVWGPTICLDLIYADVVRASVLAGAEALINLSNDSWLGADGRGAAEQQFAQTVFRAVENRRDVVRAATTGISAVVSAAGVPLEVLGERRDGALVAPVTARRALTVYTRSGDVFAAACIALAAAVMLAPLAVRVQRRSRRVDA